MKKKPLLFVKKKIVNIWLSKKCIDCFNNKKPKKTLAHTLDSRLFEPIFIPLEKIDFLLIKTFFFQKIRFQYSCLFTLFKLFEQFLQKFNILSLGPQSLRKVHPIKVKLKIWQENVFFSYSNSRLFELNSYPSWRFYCILLPVRKILVLSLLFLLLFFGFFKQISI